MIDALFQAEFAMNITILTMLLSITLAARQAENFHV
jgi:hypothetical protein